MEWLVDGFWDEGFWLPPNVTWDELDEVSKEPGNYSGFWYLWYPLPAALLLIACRATLSHIVFRPLGTALGLQSGPRRQAPLNPVLEEAYLQSRGSSAKNSLLSDKSVDRLATDLGWSSRQVHRWLRVRRQQERRFSTLDKFCETLWKWIYYSSIFAFGLHTVWAKDWLWDIKQCWENYPRHGVDSSVWWYYMVELTFYWSMAILQFFDSKRKDFWEMFIHHIITISLLSFSWTSNLFRVGTLVLVLHDCADIFLEMAKLLKYLKCQRLCDVVFVIFTVLWIVTRLVILPSWILRSTLVDAPAIIHVFPAYLLFTGLLLVLQGLHVIWTYFIVKIFYMALQSGLVVAKDTRSDSSDETVSSSQESKNTPTHESRNDKGNPTTRDNGTVASQVASGSSHLKNE